jgi:hypothetical protein
MFMSLMIRMASLIRDSVCAFSSDGVTAYSDCALSNALRVLRSSLSLRLLCRMAGMVRAKGNFTLALAL